MDGIAEVASDHIGALSWKRSVVSGSLQSILKKLRNVRKRKPIYFIWVYIFFLADGMPEERSFGR